jgi:hypothetical protein
VNVFVGFRKPLYGWKLEMRIPEIDEISGFHGGEYEDVLWDLAPFSLVEGYRRFRGSCCLHH